MVKDGQLTPTILAAARRFMGESKRGRRNVQKQSPSPSR